MNENKLDKIEKLIEAGLKLLITKVRQSNSLDKFISSLSTPLTTIVPR